MVTHTLQRANLSYLLDLTGVLDEDEGGHRLIDLESRQMAQFLLIQLTAPFHIVGNATIVVVALEGSECHSLGEPVEAQVLV